MLLDKIKEVMKKNKDAVFYDESEIITYEKLNKYVVNLYKYLIEIKKSGEKNNIVIYGHKSIYMIVSMLACSFAGITYIPVDMLLGKKRANDIIEIVKPICIININGDKISENEIGIDEIKSIVNNENNLDIELIPLMKPNDIYYTLFTSGSTGIPKGVKVTYKNINTFTENIVKVIDINKSVVLNQASFSFDLSVADIYLTILTASKYVILNNTDIRNYSEMYKKIKSNKVEVIISTPTFIDYLLIDRLFNRENFKYLKKIYMCGEILHKKTVDELFKRFNDINIINAYGPTECTVAVTSINIDSNMERIPVGKEEDRTFYIVDDNSKILPEKEKGNILIYGDLVTDGYINYNNDKFIKLKNEKAYLTGDIGYIENGKLYYISRIDRQIKLNGYRIELGEIENKIANIYGVTKCIVVPIYNNINKITKLMAYIVCNKSKETLKNEIKSIMPKYMLPDIKIVEKLPVNNNYKIDVKKIEEQENERENN